MISTVMFDFGGVLAEEGFREGFLKLAAKWNCDAVWLKQTAVETIYSSGYVSGLCEEETFWELLAQNTGIRFEVDTVREFLIGGFVLRPDVIQYTREIREAGYHVVLLSDHTDWLDELNQRTPFFHLFDRVYSSYHVHKNKRDGTIYPYVLADVGVAARDVVLIDDNIGNIERAIKLGFNGVHFTGIGPARDSVESILSQAS